MRVQLVVNEKNVGEVYHIGNWYREWVRLAEEFRKEGVYRWRLEFVGKSRS